MRVAVAGAGIAGLTAAIALSARGFIVDVYERAAGLEEIGAGIQLSPNAMAVLERLGVAEELSDSVSEPGSIMIHDAPSGVLLTSIPLGATARKRYGAPYWVVHRADLQSALLRVASRHPRLAIHLGSAVAPIRETQEGVFVRVDGRDRRADVLVAADGVNSVLRRRHFGYPAACSTGHAAWRATLAASAVPQSVRMDVTGLWLAPGAHLVHYPLRRGAELNIVAIAAAPLAARPPDRFGPALAALLDAVHGWTPWPLLDVDVSKRWARGRAALIGDAAHAMLPTAAQGGAQAIEDAWELARCLAAGSGTSEALAFFERARRPRVERIVRHARRNLAIYEMKGLSASARNAALSRLPASLFSARLDWLFSWKPQ